MNQQDIILLYLAINILLAVNFHIMPVLHLVLYTILLSLRCRSCFITLYVYLNIVYHIYMYLSILFDSRSNR